ncbi:MAG: hypothetical protein AAFY28_12525 [Actinomycetota bacterium]
MTDWPESALDHLAPLVDTSQAHDDLVRRRHRRQRIARSTSVATVAALVVVGVVALGVLDTGNDPGERVVSSDATSGSVPQVPVAPTEVDDGAPATSLLPSTTAATPESTVASLMPMGATSSDPRFRQNQLDISSGIDPVDPDVGVLSFRLQVGFGLDERTGVIVAPDRTSDDEIAIDVECPIDECFNVQGNDFETQTDLLITATFSRSGVTDGEHVAPFVLELDDGTTTTFDLVLLAQSDDPERLAAQIAEPTGAPQPVQTVFGVGNFAYHAVAGFDSIWIAGTASRTVARLDATSGELIALISMNNDPSSSGPNRLAVGADAIYAAGQPLVRIDPVDNTVTRVDGGIRALGVTTDGDTAWAAGFDGVQRVAPDGTITTIDLPQRRWFDMAYTDGLVWVLNQHRGGGEVVALDPATGETRHDIALDLADNEFAVSIVADDDTVVVGTDTTGGGWRAGRVLTIDPSTGSPTSAIDLDSRPEGIVLTPHYIWTSGAVIDRSDLAVLLDDQGFGFTITRGPDGSIWGTSSLPSTFSASGTAVRWAPGEYRDGPPAAPADEQPVATRAVSEPGPNPVIVHEPGEFDDVDPRSEYGPQDWSRVGEQIRDALPNRDFPVIQTAPIDIYEPGTYVLTGEAPGTGTDLTGVSLPVEATVALEFTIDAGSAEITREGDVIRVAIPLVVTDVRWPVLNVSAWLQ